MIALRVARAVLNWGVAESADIIGVDECTLRRWEAGRSCPSPDALERIRAAYGEALTAAETYYGNVQARKRGRPGA